MSLTRRLILLRHAKADNPAGVADHDRPLAPRGRTDAPRIGAELTRRGLVPDMALVSDARRTRQTFALLGLAIAPTFVPSIYEAEPSDILAAIRTVPAAVETLLVVGHNPGFELVARYLARFADVALLNAPGEKFPTGAFAVLAVNLGNWADLHAASMTVEAFVRPVDIETR
jgi:phosphohistidine phosphatase